MPGFKINTNNFNLPNKLKLADPKFNIPGTIEMLIGADLFWQRLQSEKVGKNLPILLNTKLDWIVSDPLGVPRV